MRSAILLMLAAMVVPVVTGCGDDPKPPAPVPVQTSKTPVPPATPAPPAPTTPRVETTIAPLSNAGGAMVSPAEPPASTDATPRPVEPMTPLPIYRPADVRPLHDAEKLATYGIHTFESKRLRLHTDIDPELARTLPRFVDAVYDAWVDYFGPLPPNREGTDYQITGYIMADKELFRRLGLLPADLLEFVNGRHRGAEFWMIDPPQEYYLRHLMIHEATHCFMTTMPDTRAPVWYLEGMAELFGTHRIDADGSITFRVMPENRIDYAGLGRIDMVRADVAAGRFRTLSDVDGFQPNDFLKNEPYAWSWALCKLLDTHPRYREKFRELGRNLTGSQFARAFRELFGSELPDLRIEWALVAHDLREGYDFERSAIAFIAGTPFPTEDDAAASQTVAIAAARGWQASGLKLQQGRTYRLRASGQFTLAQQPKPWISEPQGITIRYFDGRPLGMLVAAIRRDETTASNGPQPRESMLDVLPVGREATITTPVTGTLYLRVNDSWSELADNQGAVRVKVEVVEP